MMTVTEFCQVARSIQGEAARLNLCVPAFRSPCHVGTRAIRRTRSGQVVVLVSYVGREAHDVTRDLIDGTCAAQGDLGEVTEQIRSALWIAAGEAVSV